MATLLMVNSSPRTNSVSSALTRRFATDWQARNPGGRMVERNLANAQLPFLNEAWIAAAYTPEAQRSAAQRELLALSDQLIDEVLAADVILLGVPIHNFSMPAAFKAWIDQIARAGKTFNYSDRGPVGLVPAGKQVIAVISRGGAYAGDRAAPDTLVAYLRQVLAFVGLTNLSFVHADRQSLGGDASALSLAQATQQIDQLTHGNTGQLAA